MPTLRFSPGARDDLKQIARFIAHDKPKAAREFVAKIKNKCRVVAMSPDAGDDRPELGQGIRSTYVGSYVIYFRRSDGIVEIVRVIRGDRDTRLL